MTLSSKLNIAWQLTILGALIAAVSIAVVSTGTLRTARGVLTDQAVAELDREGIVRQHEVRDHFRNFWIDIRQTADNINEIIKQRRATQPKLSDANVVATPDFAADLRANLQKRILKRKAIGAHAFQRFIDPATILEVRCLSRSDGEAVKTLCRVPAPLQRDEAAGPPESAFHDGFDGLARMDQQWFMSDIYLDASAGERPRSYMVMAWGVTLDEKKAPTLIVAFVFDMARYFDNLQQLSPRQYFLLASARNGLLLAHPLRDRLGHAINDPSSEDGRVWHFQGLDWNSDGPDGPHELVGRAELDSRALPLEWAPADKGREAREEARQKGVTLPPSWAYWRAVKSLSERLSQKGWEALQDALREESSRDASLRYSDLRLGATALFLSHPDLGRLDEVQKLVSRIEAENSDGAAPEDWQPPVHCEHFGAVLTRLKFMADDRKQPGPQVFLITAMSREDVPTEVLHAINRTWASLALPVLVVASLLGLLVARWLTLPICRIREAAKQMAEGKYNVALSERGPREVYDLVHSFRRMADEIRRRDRELTDSLARLRSILGAAAEGVITFDFRGRIDSANDAANRMFGYADGELTGGEIFNLIDLPEEMREQDDLRSSQDTAQVAAELRGLPTVVQRGRRKDGTTFWLEVAFSEVPGQRLFTGLFRDVTQRRRDEEQIRRMNLELQESNQRLDRRVRERTVQLEDAKAKLEDTLRQAEAAVKAKDTFVANMSHELRQPLHIIIGFAEALKEDADDASLVRDLDKILSAAKHLLGLINDLLDLAKISAGRMDLTVGDFSLSTLLKEVQLLADPLVRKNSNAFELDAPADPGRMTADERKVRQILLNLLSNACKFTTQGRVSLRVRRGREGGRDWVDFVVSDSGRGMSPEQVTRLFQRFYQADASTTREQSGTGLGLAITQSLCEMMGGTIRVTSAVGAGSEFHVRLPAAVAPQPEAPAPAPTPAAAQEPALPPACTAGRTLLVIDDDERVRELMERFLSRQGFRVVTARDGQEGLRLAKELRPCAITLDVMIPGVDGWAVLAALKSDAATQDIPVVMLTIVDDPQRGFALGAADYIIKPIDWQRLGAILAKYVDRGSSRPVLVIDDDPRNRELIFRHLSREGWVVVEAENGRAALDQVGLHLPAAILLDLMMPEMDGFQFLEGLDALHLPDPPPVIVMTAMHLSDQDRVRLTGRVTQIVQKGDPGDAEEFLNKLHRHVLAAVARPSPREPVRA